MTKESPLLAKNKERLDIGEWVIHFTRGGDEKSKENLKKILAEGLKGQGGYICFTEAPLAEYVKLFEVFDKYPRPMFSPYGVAIKKDWLFRQGGRPVIYLSEDQKKYLHKKIEFLHVRYEPGREDFTWQREWRIKKKLLRLDPSSTMLIVRHDDDAYGIAYEVDVDCDVDAAGEILEQVDIQEQWEYTCLEEILRLSTNAYSERAGMDAIVSLARERFKQ